MRTAIYSRVSTAYQSNDSQLSELREYAKRADLNVIYEFSDFAISGKKESRPSLNQLMKIARNYELDCILVWKFDRFARSTSHLLKALEEFNYLKIRFISTTNNIDTNSPMGKMMFNFIAMMSEFESDLISERVKSGMANAKAKGKILGRPKSNNKEVSKIEKLAGETELSINQIIKESNTNISRAVVAKIIKNIRDLQKSDILNG